MRTMDKQTDNHESAKYSPEPALLGRAGAAALDMVIARPEGEGRELSQELDRFAAQFDKDSPLTAAEKRASFGKVLEDIYGIGERATNDGYGKLMGTIGEIADSPNGGGRFQDGKVEYLPAKGEAIFIGDTHGDLISTKKAINDSDFLGKMMRGEDVQLVFLGDYGDRGTNSVGNMAYIFKLKTMFPDNVTLMRGNHETKEMLGRGEAIDEFAEAFYSDAVDSAVDADGVRTFNAHADYRKGKMYQAKRLAENIARIADVYMPDIVVAGNGVVAVHGGLPIEEFDLTNVNRSKNLRFQLNWNDPKPEGESSPSYDRHDTPRAELDDKYRKGGSMLAMSFNETDFLNRLQGIGGKVLVRSHEYNRSELMFGNKLLTIFSSGAGSSDTKYPDVNPSYAVVDLSKEISEFEGENIHRLSSTTC